MPRRLGAPAPFLSLAGLIVSAILLSITPGAVAGPRSERAEVASAATIATHGIAATALSAPVVVDRGASEQERAQSRAATPPRRSRSNAAPAVAQRLLLALRVGRAAQDAVDALERRLAEDPRVQRELARVTAAREQAAAEAQARAEAAARAAAAARAKAQAEARARAEAARFRGRNHFWYPALGISHSVDWFPCDRARPPDNLVYRWGCSGRGNVYVMAHAWGWFRPLNQAYYAGTLQPGQLVAYADNDGRTHFYRLDWWKTWRPLPSASWAWASQSRSSLTLQTCVGANSELRLFVRFHEVPHP
jgi:hypothetical protein